MGELLLGIICGIALSLFFSFGPAFFTQIRTSIQYGFKRSYPFAFGVSAGDVIIVFLMLTVLKNADLYSLVHNVWVASIAGGVLLAMAVYLFRKNVTALEAEECAGRGIKFQSKGSDPSRWTIFFQGFLINFVNPVIWIYWVSVIALITGELNLTVAERYEFFVGVMGATLGMDITKCKLAALLQRIVTAKMLNVTNKVCAAILVVFAVYLVVSMVGHQNAAQQDTLAMPQQPKSTEMIKSIHNKMDSGTFFGTHGADTTLLNLFKPKKRSTI